MGSNSPDRRLKPNFRASLFELAEAKPSILHRTESDKRLERRPIYFGLGMEMGLYSQALEKSQSPRSPALSPRPPAQRIRLDCASEASHNLTVCWTSPV